MQHIKTDQTQVIVQQEEVKKEVIPVNRDQFILCTICQRQIFCLNDQAFRVHLDSHHVTNSSIRIEETGRKPEIIGDQTDQNQLEVQPNTSLVSM